jgi:hypothetical protein
MDDEIGGGSKKAKPTDIGIKKPSVYAEGTAALRGDNHQARSSNSQKGVFRRKRPVSPEPLVSSDKGVSPQLDFTV